MAQNQILIGKNVNYAASKASTTADTATSPELLKDGAIGFYTETGTLIPAAGTGMSTATRFFIAQGTSTGCIVTPILDKRSTLKTKYNKDYTAPVRQVSYVGYNGSTGSLATPSIANDDEALIKIIETTVGRQVFPKQTYTAILDASQTDVDIAAELAYEINNVAFATQTSDFVVAEVVSDGTLSNYAITVTNGSRVVTLGGTTPTIDVAVGDYIKFNASATPTNANGVVYKVTAISAGVSFTLDRAFEGTTQTLTEAEGEGTRLKKVASITEAGVRLTSASDGKHFRLAVGGSIEDATITYTTPFNPGSGTYAQVSQLEKDFTGASRGSWNKVGPYATYGTPTLYADSTATYDMYNITTINQNKDKSGMDGSIGVPIYVIIANHASATTVNTALDTITAAI
jgi:hypothetical protein